MSQHFEVWRAEFKESVEGPMFDEWFTYDLGRCDTEEEVRNLLASQPPLNPAWAHHGVVLVDAEGEHHSASERFGLR
jgi:hypothetical protein